MKNKIGKKRLISVFSPVLRLVGEKNRVSVSWIFGDHIISVGSVVVNEYGGGGRGRGDKKLDFQLIGNEVGS